MWFKNLCLFQFADEWNVAPGTLEETLAGSPLQPCSGLATATRGWVSPRDNGVLVESSGRHMLIAFGQEQKLLPASVVNQEAQERARTFEAQRGYKPGRKHMRDIKDEVTTDLLPRAFARRRTTRAWIDPSKRWFVVDASSATLGEEVVETFRATVEDAPSIGLVETDMSLGMLMTEWLASGQAPGRFVIEDECELCGVDETKATVRYLRHPLNSDDIRKHIQTGKRVTRMGLSWDNKISFVLTDTLQVKKVKLLEVAATENESGADDADEQFQQDFTLMTGELGVMLEELVAQVRHSA